MKMFQFSRYHRLASVVFMTCIITSLSVLSASATGLQVTTTDGATKTYSSGAKGVEIPVGSVVAVTSNVAGKTVTSKFLVTAPDGISIAVLTPDEISKSVDASKVRLIEQSTSSTDENGVTTIVTKVFHETGQVTTTIVVDENGNKTTSSAKTSATELLNGFADINENNIADADAITDNN